MIEKPRYNPPLIPIPSIISIQRLSKTGHFIVIDSHRAAIIAYLA